MTRKPLVTDSTQKNIVYRISRGITEQAVQTAVGAQRGLSYAIAIVAYPEPNQGWLKGSKTAKTAANGASFKLRTIFINMRVRFDREVVIHSSPLVAHVLGDSIEA